MKKETKYIKSIRRKITLVICSAALFVLCVGFGLWYYKVFVLLRNTVGEDNVKIAENLTISVSSMIDEFVKDIEVYSINSTYKDTILESMSKYKGMSAGAIKEYLLDMDKKWVQAEMNSHLINEHLYSKSGRRLKEYTLADSSIAEIFITDKFGGLIASSGKTSDYYQADEEWWQTAYSNGEGKIFVGEIAFDESSNEMGMAIAVPIKDEKGEVIGVIKAILNVNVIFEPLSNFRTGKTGHAFLVNNDGFIIFHANIKPLRDRFLSERDFKQLLQNKKGWDVLKRPRLHEEDLFYAFAMVKSRFLQENGIAWRVFIAKDVSEVFEPVKILIIEMMYVLGILLIIILPVGFIFGGVFIKPIKKLHEAIERISKGELDYPIDVKTGDEIENLADAFRFMVLNVKEKQEEVLQLVNNLRISKQKIEEYSKDLESMVRERTAKLEESMSELKGSREVMLSILEDTDEAKKKLEKTLEELREKEQQLIRAGKLSGIGEMAAGVAHEINNPLTSILGYSQLIMSQKDIDPVLMENLQTIEKESKRCVNIIENLLNFASPREIQKMPVDINNVLDMTLKVVEYSIKRERIEVVKKYGSNLLKVMGDINQLEQVFMNIIINAVHAMPGGGSITIETRALRKFTFSNGESVGFLEVCFKDTGFGMSKEIQEKIFDPFFTTAYTRGQKGAGLGLSISYTIIKEHGGRIEVESEEGKGSEFRVILPVDVAGS